MEMSGRPPSSASEMLAECTSDVMGALEAADPSTLPSQCQAALLANAKVRGEAERAAAPEGGEVEGGGCGVGMIMRSAKFPQKCLVLRGGGGYSLELCGEDTPGPRGVFSVTPSAEGEGSSQPRCPPPSLSSCASRSSFSLSPTPFHPSTPLRARPPAPGTSPPPSPS